MINFEILNRISSFQLRNVWVDFRTFGRVQFSDVMINIRIRVQFGDMGFDI